MSDPYRHFTAKFADAGLQLRLPVDLVPPMQYSRITNAIPVIEGVLETRPGLALIATVLAANEIHTIFRLNQEVTSVTGDRIVGVSTRLFTAPLPLGNTFIERTDFEFSGNPLSIISFRFSLDQAAWAVIGDQNGMRKYRGGSGAPGFYYQKLGVTAPTVAATASDGGAGNLNSSGGTPFDWRYTYLNRVTGSESNPSPILQTLALDVKRPTAFTNPDGEFGGAAFSDPGNAIDGSASTFAFAITDSALENRFSCQWNVWAAAGTTPENLKIAVNAETIASGLDGAAFTAIYYSLDAGVTWKTMMFTSVTTARKTYTADIPVGIAYSDLRVRAVVFSSGVIDERQDIVTRRARLVGGDFEAIDLIDEGILVGGGGDRSLTLRVYDIFATAAPINNTDTTLALVNRQALVCVHSPTEDSSTGVMNPTSGVNNSLTGTLPWSNPGSIKADDGAYAQVTVGTPTDPDTSQWLVASGFSLPFPIPVDATILGFIPRVTGQQLAGGAGGTVRIRMLKNGVLEAASEVTDGLGSYPNGADTTVAYGGATDLMGLTWTSADVNAANLGFGFQVQGIGGVGATATVGIDHMTLDIFFSSPSDRQITHIRLYRRGGSLPDDWFRVGEYPISELTAGACGVDFLSITDNIPDSGLGTPLALDNDVPVSSVEQIEVPLPYIWGPFDERVLGCGDPNRPESVYFSKRGNADQWPPQNFIEVSSPGEPIINGAVFNTRTFAFSRERMYELVPNLIGGVTFTPYPTPCAHGLVSPWGLAVADAIYFVAKDGIYRTTGGPEQSIVENDIKPLFPTKDAPGRSVNGYEAVNMDLIENIRLTYHNDEMWFTYTGADTGAQQTLIYDTERGRWRAAGYIPAESTFYSEESTQSSLLMGSEDGRLFQTAVGSDAGTNIVVNLRTGAYDMGMPLNLKEFGNVIFDLDPGGATAALPITITPLRNGEVLTDAAITVTGTGRQQVPLSLSDVFGFNMEFQVEWTRTAAINPRLYQLDVLWRPEPVSVKHWEAREQSFGLPGFFHLRDAYIGIRSSADVTLTVTMDGVTTTYTLAPTASARRKVYVPLAPNKGKVCRLMLDSTGEFRVYEPDVEVRVKAWLTNLGYRVVRAVGGEGGDPRDAINEDDR